ncbi:MAG: hypothetical protein ACOYYS_03870 [Chloroflexota bacterium]
MELANKFITPGIVFILTVAFGFWLSFAGRPYNGILFNVHKLIALGAVVVTIMQTVKTFRETGVQALPLLLVILAAVCAMALFATGALMSMEKFSYEVSRVIHRVAPVLALLAMVVAVVILRTGKP